MLEPDACCLACPNDEHEHCTVSLHVLEHIARLLTRGTPVRFELKPVPDRRAKARPLPHWKPAWTCRAKTSPGPNSRHPERKGPPDWRDLRDAVSARLA